MLVWVKEAHPVGGFVVRVRFSTDEVFDIDLHDQLAGSVFEPLRDPGFFRRLYVDPDIETVVWPNGADVAPEFLYDLARAQHGGKAEAPP